MPKTVTLQMLKDAVIKDFAADAAKTAKVIAKAKKAEDLYEFDFCYTPKTSKLFDAYESQEETK